MPSSITAKDVERFERFLSAPPEIHKIAEGLNQTYTLASVNNRLALLWAIIEAVFADRPKPLLSKSEIEAIIKCAKNILKEPERLKKLENILRDPNILPSESRNRRISDKIAEVLGLNAEEVYQKIKTASKNRGKYLHEFKDDKEFIESENYLRKILETYLERMIKSDS